MIYSFFHAFHKESIILVINSANTQLSILTPEYMFNHLQNQIFYY